jgi:hypothetical protein
LNLVDSDVPGVVYGDFGNTLEAFTLGPSHKKMWYVVRMQIPKLGASVYYQAYGTPGGEFLSVPRAAVITEVLPDGTAKLCIFNPTGLFFSGALAYSEEDKPGTWRYPPKDPPGKLSPPPDL